MSLAESPTTPDHHLPGLTEPTRRGRSSRFIGDIVVDLGYANARVGRGRDRGVARQRATHRRGARRARRPDARSALARGRRALRRRPDRPRRLQGRHVRRQPAALELGQALRRGAGEDARRPHAAGRDDRSGQRPRRRRHLADERLRGASRRRARAGHRRAHPAPEHPGRGHRRRGDRRRRRRARSSTCASRPPTPRSSSSCTRSSARASSRAPPTSTSSPSRATSSCATASTACSARPRACRGAWWPGVISRIKIMADLDIAERRVPQDGRVSLNIDGRGVDVRVATLPLVGGESAVLRVLDKDGRRHRPRQARDGRPHERERFVKAFRSPTARSSSPGPTGSGKTTTLYAALQHAAHAREEHHHHRGPRRVRDVGHQADAGQQPQAGLGFANGPAVDDARRPRHHHGRRDPRQGDGADRGRGRAHRPPRALDAAHQRRAGRDRAPDRDGRRAVPRRLRGGLRRRPAPGPAPVRALQAAGHRRRRHPARPRLRGRRRRRSCFEPGSCPRCGGTGYKGRVGLYEVMPINEEIRALAVAARRPTRSPRRRSARACAACAPRAPRRCAPA